MWFGALRRWTDRETQPDAADGARAPARARSPRPVRPESSSSEATRLPPDNRRTPPSARRHPPTPASRGDRSSSPTPRPASRPRAPTPRSRSSVDLALDQAHRPDRRVEEGLELGDQSPIFLASGRGDRVEAAGPAVRMLPLALDQPAGLEVTKQRIDGVRVHGDDPVGDPLDLLDQAIPVGGLAS